MKTFYKHRKIHIRKWILCAFIFTCSMHANAFLSGTYTLDPLQPASATNYQNLSSFATDLYAGTRTDGGTSNGPGVSGAVVLRMASGLNLTEQVEFRDAPGSSLTNTITIKGNLSLIQFNATVSTSKYTIWLNGAKFYTFDSVNIRANSSTLAWGIRFSNDASQNTITNCSIILPNITSGVSTSTTSTTTQAAICFTASSSILDYTSNSSTSAGNNGSNNKINNCVIGGTSTTLGPTYAIFENLTNTTGNNAYTNNKIQHFYQEGLACHTADGIIITGNDFNRLGNTNIPAITMKGINLYNNVRATVNPVVVTNNTIHDISNTSTLYGYYHIHSSTYITGYNGGNRLSSFNNNKVYNLSNTTSSLYGIYVYQVKNAGGYEVMNNEVYRNVSTGSTLYGIYTYNDDKMNSNANMVRNNKGSTIYCMYDAGSSTNSAFTNNLVFKNIATGNEYGFYLGGSGSTWLSNKYANNTIAFDSVGWTSGNTYGLYISAGSAVLPKTNNSIFNNNIYIGHKGSSTAIKYGIYNLWGYTDYQEERNNVYFDTANVTPALTFYGSEFSGPLIQLATLADWINLGFSNKDFNVNPYFIKSTYSDYRIGNMILNNIGTNVGLSKDLVGTTRVVSAPDVGALESVFNLKIASTNTINSSVCAGYSDTIRVTVGNSSSFAFRNLTLGVSLNGVVYSTRLVPNVAMGNNTVVFTSKLLNLSKPGNNTVRYFIMGKDDISTLDDTITKVINVIASPGGGVISLKAGSKGILNHPLGYDVTAFDEPITYVMSKPSKYTDLEYGTKWSVQTWATNASGTLLPGGTYTFTHPSNTEMVFRPSVNYVDQFLFLYTKVIDAVTGCDTTFIRKIFVAPRGVIRYTVPSSVCFMTDIDFVNNSVISSGDLSYTWDFGDGSPVYSGKFAKHNYAAAGIYNVTLTAISMPFGYISDTVFQVDVKEIPRTDFNKVNACEGNNIILTNTTKVNSGTPVYTWDFGDGSPVSNAVNVNKRYANPGIYVVKLTASKGGCEHTVSKNVYQFARPKADFVKTAGSCVNAPFSFNNTSSLTIGTNATLWDFNDAGNTSTDHAPVYTFKSAGTKNVRLTVVSEFGCRDSIVKPVTVAQAPVADFTFPSACDASPTTFNNTSNLNNEALLGYTWDFGDGTVSSATNPVKNWAKAGTRQVRLRAVLMNGCSSEITKTVNVGIQPDVDFNLTDACSGSPVSFENLTDYNPSKIVYTWSFGDGITSNDNSPNHIYNTSLTQTFTVKLKGSIISGCADSVSKTVTITALPSTCSFDIAGNTNSATKTNFSFVPKGGSMANTTYTWSTGDGTTLTSSGSGVNYRYDAPGVFCVRMVAKNLGGCQCEATKCITLTTDINNPESMNSALSVYPNPTSGIVSVKFDAGFEGEMTVQVYNALGILVKTISAAEHRTELDLSEFASGVYMVKVLADGYTATQKVTVSR